LTRAKIYALIVQGILFMVFLSVKKLEIEIKNRSITSKQFIVYSLFVLGSFYSLLKTSKYPVNIETYNIAYMLSFVPIIIDIIKYIICYKIIKDENINLFLYSIIPINFVLNLKYLLFLMFPMIVTNIFLIRFFDLEYDYWNVINSQIITIIYQTVIAINSIHIYKKLYLGDSKDMINIIV
jgi:hypothetical protein